MSTYFPITGDNWRISSGSGARTPPKAGASSNHKGVDIAAPRGTPIIAPVDMTITKAGWQKGYGNTVWGTDASGNQHLFAHMSDYNAQVGQNIAAGGAIGSVGSTGNSTGNHLHYGVFDKSKNFLSKATNTIITAGTKGVVGLISNDLRDKAMAIAEDAVKLIPGGAEAWKVGEMLGIVGSDDCDWICKIKEWLEETQFFQRAGLFLVALCLIIVALWFGKK